MSCVGIKDKNSGECVISIFIKLKIKGQSKAKIPLSLYCTLGSIG